MTPEGANHGGRWWIQLMLLPVLFYLGVKVSLVFAVMPEVLVMLWVPNSLLLAALLHYHWRRFPYFAALIIAAEIAADYPTFSLTEAVLFGAVNVIEASIAYALLRRWDFDPRFPTPSDLAKFVAAGPLVAALVSACAGAAIYSHFRGIETTFWEFLRIWWFSDGLGLLILTPLVLSLRPPVPGALDEPLRLRWYDGIALLGSVAVIAAFTFSEHRTFHGLTVRPFLLIPPVLYVAARFSSRIATTVVAAVSVLLISLTKGGHQPFGDLPIRETVVSAQELIFVMSTMSFGFAALLSQHRANTRQLEARVQARTAELSAANTQLEQLAVTDALTGVLNRRALFNMMRREMARGQRHHLALAVLVFDIDHFKEVNDRYGHLAGDAVLQRVAAVTRSVVRHWDAVARYGGEEFVVVATETDRASALELAERVRTALRSTDIPHDQGVLRVTASFGVAMLHPNDREPEQLFRRADLAMYAAKAAGRDRVVAETSMGDLAEGGPTGVVPK
jgi:diguanylate cyclase (GGDEF)-like protein